MYNSEAGYFVWQNVEDNEGIVFIKPIMDGGGLFSTTPTPVFFLNNFKQLTLERLIWFFRYFRKLEMLNNFFAKIYRLEDPLKKWIPHVDIFKNLK